MILIYDLVLYRQPAVIKRLRQLFGIRKPRALKAKVRVRVWMEDGPFEWWRSVMEERPKSGRAGLLPGESLSEEAVNL